MDKRLDILKKHYDHHKNVVNPDANWAEWESVLKERKRLVACP